ncbi:hypothetical protein PV396_12090 [Streptomyces sp. ME02-8801-2C]|uniref:hypothetical protein n=1 Tax=Streptomyces sp. ME02-8801-2C TaxID=3028680 RepID=UPI0029A0EDCE|nr:hypothetical protein [Streptomyces sp. ME02-8801-2C]MDX3452678.1 hypothetical protein [Streptomyces sp. ME02-8801-2C]
MAVRGSSRDRPGALPGPDQVFAPVCVTETFVDDNDAVAVANDTDNGLTCGIRRPSAV